MKAAIVVLLLCLCSCWAAVEDQFCEGGSCQSKESLRSMVEALRTELKDTRSQLDTANCTVCWSSPCLNGGTCVPLTVNNYRCDCPDNFAGKYCETNVTCTDKSCGKNAICFVQNHKTNCACKLGYSGNPKYGCTAKIHKSCMSGDPHYETFDGLHYDYQGTCSYVYSQTGPTFDNSRYANYAVRAKNILTANQWVSTVNEFEVDFYNKTVHVARFQNTRSYRVFLDGVLTAVPFFYPKKELYKFSITTSGNRIIVENDQLVSVTFDGQSLCVAVPDVDEFKGNGTLLGLAGDVDSRCQDDLLWPNGTYSPTQGGCQADKYVAAIFGDQWITNNWLNLDPLDVCIDGQVVTNHTKDCPDLSNPTALCAPIKQAIDGQGPFAVCQDLGAVFLQRAFDNCIFDTCLSPDLKCPIIEAFVHDCQDGIPNPAIPVNWRDQLGCQITCPLHSVYTPCASTCQATCANSDPDPECQGACQEACVCEPGYVIDNTKPSSSLEEVVCIPIEQCGCNDPNGNPHGANETWLTENCNTWNFCSNGTYHYKPNACAWWGHCTIEDNHLACVCNDGFTGDGYNCTDIDECLDPNSCSVNLGQGTCTNTNGSYYCNCTGYYEGHDCEYYRPQRHCADLYVYGLIRADGTYNITPPYPYNVNPINTPTEVYCDMTTDGGGYTLLSNAIVNLASTGKTIAQYAAGFGKNINEDTFLGLDLANGMTNDQPTSLRLNLHRCPHDAQQERFSYCTYPSFTVRDASQGYRVNIPDVCGGGTEQDFYDGWVRWNRTAEGPLFIATDNDNTTTKCSATFQNTGFWFDTTVDRCGEANLNGVRYTCDNIPTVNQDSYLFFGGQPIGDATTYLRPFGYPNYDPHPPPTVSAFAPF